MTFEYENYCILKYVVMEFERVTTLRVKWLFPISGKKGYEGIIFLQNVGQNLAGNMAPHHKRWNYSTLGYISSSFPSHHRKSQYNPNKS